MQSELTIPRLIERQAERHGSRPLVRSGHAVWSYEDTRRYASCFAHVLREAGTGVGDRVAVFSNNRLEFLRVWLGAAWAGAITVPINTALRGHQLDHVLGHSGARILVADGDLLESLTFVESALPSLERIWSPDAEDALALGSWRQRVVEPLPNGDRHEPAHPAAPGDTATILYTGGTTGPSKGVRCPHAQSYWWGRILADQLGIGEEDVLHTTLPLFHTNALNTFWQALLTGATLSLGGRFSASAFWAELADSQATVTYLLGPMVKILLRRPAGAHERDHRVRITLAPGTAPTDAADFEARSGIALVNSYGSTETNMITSTRIDGAHSSTMGRVLPLFEARVADDTDCPVPAGQAGELLLRPKQPFSFFTGYWNEPEQTVAAWRNLWFHTGDRVVADGDGCLSFVDRLTDSIRRRGENISSWEVERVLTDHPDIEDAAVVAVPAELGEDEVFAVLVPVVGRRIDPEELIEFCRPRLAAFAIPRYIEIVDELPRTQVGRVQKFVLRERGIGPDTWDRDRVEDR